MNKRKEMLRDCLLASCGALIAAINLNSFVHAGNLVPGGFSGMVVLACRIAEKYFNFKLSYSVIYVLVNIPAALLVYFGVSRRFTIISFISVFLTSFFVGILPNISITNDMLLIAVFGGIVSGFSTTLVLNANGCSGGLDFISIYLARKKQKSLWNMVFAVNACLLCVSGFLFSWDSALYSIIYQFVATQIINLKDTRFKRKYLLIVTENSDEIVDMISIRFHHSVTILDGVGGYTRKPKKMLYTVCGDYETNQLISSIQSIDPKAFINVSQSQRIVGNFHEKSF